MSMHSAHDAELDASEGQLGMQPQVTIVEKKTSIVPGIFQIDPVLPPEHVDTTRIGEACEAATLELDPPVGVLPKVASRMASRRWRSACTIER
jgi:hypothetical protein